MNVYPNVRGMVMSFVLSTLNPYEGGQVGRGAANGPKEGDVMFV